MAKKKVEIDHLRAGVEWGNAGNKRMESCVLLQTLTFVFCSITTPFLFTLFPSTWSWGRKMGQVGKGNRHSPEARQRKIEQARRWRKTG